MTPDLQMKPGKGLQVTSPDGRFSLRTGLRAQFLYSYTDSDAPGSDGSEANHGGQIRRARVKFTGHTFGKHNKFKLELAVSPKDVGMQGDNPIAEKDAHPTRAPLLDWYYTMGQIRDLNVRVGQYKVPFSRQRVISSGNLQFVDRSIVNKEFNHDRDIGLDLRSGDFLGLGHLRYYLGIYTGEGHSSFALDDFGMLYIARAEYLPFGMFKDYSEADQSRARKARLSLGLAYAHLDNGAASRGLHGSLFEDGGTTDSDTWTADMLFKWRGLSIQTEGFVRSGTRTHGGAMGDNGFPMEIDAPRDGYGWMVQAGYIVTSRAIEFAGRYAEVQGSGNSSLSESHEAGGAISYYMEGHPFKLQADYLRLYADTPSEGTDQVRVQFQAAF